MAEANILSRVRPPSGRAAFFLFLTVNLGSAFFNIITDCDETFNYWEPMHYLLYGFGLQTWEYSPAYALRSYLYILVHAIFGKVADFPVRVMLGMNKLLVFYAVRAMLGLFAAFGETVFYTGVRARFGEAVGFYTFLFLAASPGIWISVTAFLPSSFAMVCVMLSFGFWFTSHYRQAFLAAAAGVILGWPFAGLVFVPLGLDSLRNAGFLRTLKWGLSAVVLFIVPSVAVDYYYYRRPVVAIWNIVFYNVLNAGGRGSELYGTEPWTYYFVNGFLNFNILLPLALLSLPMLLLFRKWTTASASLSITQVFLYSSPFYIWFAFMSRMPHKEERFLYTVYPCICLLAASCLVALGDVLRFFSPSAAQKKSYFTISRFLKQTACLVFLLLAVSRTVSISINYHSPLSLYSFFSESELQNGKFPSPSLVPGPVNICVGKEWYRFPSNFFMPSERHQLAFIRSHFKGLLPKPFEQGPNGTSTIPSGMNDENREELSRYIDLASCHYVVDLLLDGQAEPDLYHDPKWSLVKDSQFLDASRSKSLYRAFWIPFLSAKHVTYARYYVVRNRALLGNSRK